MPHGDSDGFPDLCLEELCEWVPKNIVNSRCLYVLPQLQVLDVVENLGMELEQVHDSGPGDT